MITAEIPLKSVNFEVSSQEARFGDIEVNFGQIDNGVKFVTLSNAAGYLSVLPEHGMMVWDFGTANPDIEKSMIGVVNEPRPDGDYFENYGAFLIHCGLTAMGGPDTANGDTHPIHGELPTARYQNARLTVGHDGEVSVSADYDHRVAFGDSYAATTTLTLGQVGLDAISTVAVENLKSGPLDLMYMAHMNFRPEGLIEIVDPEYTKYLVRNEVSSHVISPDGYAEALADMTADPLKHLRPNHLDSATFDPECFLYVKHPIGQSDAETKLVYADGKTFYVRYDPRVLNNSGRVIRITDDEQNVGILPATSGPTGRAAEHEAGRFLTIGSKESAKFIVKFGLVN